MAPFRFALLVGLLPHAGLLAPANAWAQPDAVPPPPPDMLRSASPPAPAETPAAPTKIEAPVAPPRARVDVPPPSLQRPASAPTFQPAVGPDGDDPSGPRPSSSGDAEALQRLPLESRVSLETALGDFVTASSMGLGTTQVFGRFLRESTLRLGGFRLNDPEDGQWSFTPPLSALGGVDLHPLGVGASEADAAAGVVVLTPRAAGGPWEASASLSLDSTNVPAFGSKSPPADLQRSTMSAGVSGGWLSDRLRLRSDVERAVDVTRTYYVPPAATSEADIPDRRASAWRWLTTVSFSASPRHELTFTSLLNHSVVENSGRVSLDPAAQTDTRRAAYLAGVSWRWKIGPALQLDTRVGGKVFHRRLRPALCRTFGTECVSFPSISDTAVPGSLYGNAVFDQRLRTYGVEAGSALSYTHDAGSFGRHVARVGADLDATTAHLYTRHPAGYSLLKMQTQPFARVDHYVGDQAAGVTRAAIDSGERRARVFAEDTVHVAQVRGLAVTPGVSLAHLRYEDAWGRAQSAGTLVLPHVGASWRSKASRHTFVRFSFDQHAVPARLSSGYSPDFGLSHSTCLIDPATGDYDPNCVGSPALTRAQIDCDDANGICVPKLSIRRTTSVSFAGSSAVASGSWGEVWLGAEYAQRAAPSPSALAPASPSAEGPFDRALPPSLLRSRALAFTAGLQARRVSAQLTYSAVRQPLFVETESSSDPYQRRGAYAGRLQVLRLLAFGAPVRGVSVGTAVDWELGIADKCEDGVLTSVDLPALVRVSLQARVALPQIFGLRGSLFAEALSLWDSDPLAFGRDTIAPLNDVPDPRLDPRRLRVGLDLSY